jgi:hypothetical protein
MPKDSKTQQKDVSPRTSILYNKFRCLGDWIALERETRAEIQAHRDVYKSVQDMCRKLLMSLEASKEREEIHKNLEDVEHKWEELNRLANEVRERLENAQEECERLTRNLAELLHWTDMQISAILSDQPVGGDLSSIQRQKDTVNVSFCCPRHQLNTF